MTSDAASSEPLYVSWQTNLSGMDQEPPHAAVPPSPDQIVKHSFPNADRDCWTPSLLCAAWALIASRRVNLDRVTFSLAVPPQSWWPAASDSAGAVAANNQTVDNDLASTRSFHVNTTPTQSVAEYLDAFTRFVRDMTSREASCLGGGGIQHVSTPQTLLRLQSQSMCPAISISTNDEHSLETGAGDHGNEVGLDDNTARGFSLIVDLHAGTKETTAIAKFPSTVFPRRMVITLLELLGLQRNSHVPLSIDRRVHEIIGDIASSQPDLPAVCAWDGDITYGELDRLAGNLASELATFGVGVGAIVPVCFEKSLWVTVAVLAVLKAGGAFLLLDPSQPLKRLLYMTQVTESKFVLSSRSTQPLSSQLASAVIIVDAASLAQLEKRPSVPRPPPFPPSSIMYAVFTSGSTGLPKCVVITHVNVASAMHHQARLLGFDSDARILDYSSYSFTTTISNFFGALTTGGCLCIPSEQDRQNDLAQAIRSLRVNVIDITPSVLQTLDPAELPALKVIIFGGEVISATELARWWGKVRLINLYGQSECTANATINDGPRTLRDVSSIGHGAGLVTWIVEPDDHDKLAPVGWVGELLLEGPLVGRGYLNDTERTSAVFIEDPKWLLQGHPALCSTHGTHLGRRGRIYKTGDLVQYREDGSLLFHGRKDNQVKIRGQRVELGEVEHWVRKCTGAKQVAAKVIIPRGEGASPTLVTFLQGDVDQADAMCISMNNEAGFAIDLVSSEVLCCLSEHLPAYMRPTAFFWMPSLPTMTSRKLDRKKLRRIGATVSVEELAAGRTTKLPKEQPFSEVQLSIRKIWAAVLHLPPDSIGIDDSFFHLGGDSVAAIKVVSELRRAGMRITVADILSHPIIRVLASYASQSQPETQAQIKPFSLLGDNACASAVVRDICTQYNFESAMVQEMYPCTPLQEGLVSLAFKRIGNYIEQTVFELNPQTAAEDLRIAWQEVVRAFPILRTRFAQHAAAGLVQVVLNDSVPWVDAATSLEEYLECDRKCPMELGSPLARYALVKDEVGSSKWLVWTVHHAICDGWTANLIKNAVQAVLYGDPIIPGPPFQNFIDYVKRGDESAAIEYWGQSLADCECPVFPTLPPSIDHPVASEMIRTEIPQPRTSRRNITASAFLRAAWGLLIGRLTSSPRAVFGVTVSGRNAPVADIEALAAPTFATVPAQVTLGGSQRVSDYLGAVQQHSITMIPFEQTGLQTIARVSQACRDACMFQSLLVIQPPESNGSGRKAIDAWKEVPQHQQQWLNTYALTLQIRLGLDTMQVDASFDPRVVEVSEMQRILDRLRRVLAQLDAADDSMTVGQIQVLTSQELDLIWRRNSHVPTPAGLCVHHAIEDIVMSQPDALAIDGWDGRLTYMELDSTAEVLAQHLVELGIQPDTLVPLCFEKSTWTSVAMLAVLKARAGFVLLEPFSPKRRLETILAQIDSHIALASPTSSSVMSPLIAKVVEVNAR
ncbi:hypothetical protein F5Y07DRAFT_411506 [Xylaria sp. FL0933]|nr:hypothetical protein F5Y07DRAFT_411506 [Xylaria sp. FL0933]